MKGIRTFKKVNYDWCCPKLLVFVDENGYIVGNQANADNDLTRQWANDEDGVTHWGLFENNGEFEEVTIN